MKHALLIVAVIVALATPSVADPDPGAPAELPPSPAPSTPVPTPPVAADGAPAAAPDVVSTAGTRSRPAAPPKGGAVPSAPDAGPTAIAASSDTPVREDHKVAAGVTVASMYTVFAGWMYVAWYRQHKPLDQYKWGGDGWLGDRTYAGGADKFGHAWSTMALARLGTEMLDQWGGYDRANSALVATALAEALFIGVEVRDGFFFEFSFSDLTGDTIGALMAYALSRWPRLDELFDYRVQYFPSQMYLRKLDGSSPCPPGGCSRWNIAEDYSGETYLLALHLGAIHALSDMPYAGWTHYVDLALGFDSRNYKPQPDADLHVRPNQEMFIGVSLNIQGVFDRLLEGRGTVRKVAHGLGEVFNLPFTSAGVFTYRQYPTGVVANGGA